MISNLKNYNIILASASPRREQLLRGLDLNFSVELTGEIDEHYDPNMAPHQVPEYLSIIKSHGFKRQLKSNEILVTADTIVICNDTILGKPKSKEEAISMLHTLSGIKHTVLTGVTIRDYKSERSFTAETSVWFKKLTEEEIIYYVNQYKPFDKAGSYGAQEWIGYIAIEKIEGSYFNVMGLPTRQLFQELIKFSAQNTSSNKK